MKVTITLEDIEEGRVRVRAEFDPPVDDETDLTPASRGAIAAIEAIHAEAEEITYHKVIGVDDDEPN